MKRFLIVIVCGVLSFLYLLTIPSCANSTSEKKDITQFMGIPIEGTRQEMMDKLQNIGFIASSSDSDLQGYFNGQWVDVYLGVHKGQVWRVDVLETQTYDENDIKHRYNQVLNQFKDSPKYQYNECDATEISYDEDIMAYLIDGWGCVATFFQKPQEVKEDADPKATEEEEPFAMYFSADGAVRDLTIINNKAVGVWINGNIQVGYKIQISYQNLEEDPEDDL